MSGREKTYETGENGSTAKGRGGGKGKGKRMETVLGLKEERKSIAFISYTVNLVSGSNDS